MKKLALVSMAVGLVASACSVTLDVADSDPTPPAIQVPIDGDSQKSTTTESAQGTTTTTLTPAAFDPRDASAIAGNAAPALPEGEDGMASVVGTSYRFGRFTGFTEVFLVIRNNTEEEMRGAEVSLVARDAEGALVAAGSSSQMYPHRIEPGGIAFGSVFMLDTELPAGTEFEFDITPTDRPESWDRNVDLSVIEYGHSSNNILAIVENDPDKTVAYTEVAAACFDSTGGLTWVDDAYVDPSELAPGAQGSVSIDVDNADCTIYLVAATGRNQL